jgi:hypothetical protein
MTKDLGKFSGLMRLCNAFCDPPKQLLTQVQTHGQHKMPSMRSNGRDGSTFPAILPRLCTRAVGAGESHQMQTQHENATGKPEISARAQKLHLCHS